MKKIGREVLFLAPKENNPRNGEGTFLRLMDGSILFVYSGFTGEYWGDDCPSDIRGIYSYDEGETWVNDRVLLVHDEASANYMCPSLLRMGNGDLGLFYLRKKKYMNAITDDICLVRSCDEGQTWSEPVYCTNGKEYFVMENDHVIRLKSGRIVIPLNLHSGWDGETFVRTGHGLMCMVASDDDGRSWTEISGRYDIPLAQCSATGLQETMIYQMEDGTVRAMSRTDMAYQYECFSEDDCVTWSEILPNRFFSSPDSPLLMKRVGQSTVAVFNPIPRYTGRDPKEPWGRTPLVMAVSEDDSKTFQEIYCLEDDPANGYCYPAIFAGEDYILVSYYHSNNTGIPLNSTKIIKIMKEEF